MKSALFFMKFCLTVHYVNSVSVIAMTVIIQRIHLRGPVKPIQWAEIAHLFCPPYHFQLFYRYLYIRPQKNFPKPNTKTGEMAKIVVKKDKRNEQNCSEKGQTNTMFLRVLLIQCLKSNCQKVKTTRSKSLKIL